MSNSKTIGMIGFGRFGRLLADILHADFEIKVCDPNADVSESAKAGFPIVDMKIALAQDTIFYCIPISTFEAVIKEHTLIYKMLGGQKTIIDVLSVKSHPKIILKKLLADLSPLDYDAILTHPMFGPDSARIRGLTNQRIVMDGSLSKPENFNFWKEYFELKQLRVLEISCDEHDRLAAKSQAVAHLIGRILNQFDLQPTTIDTLAAESLCHIKDQMANDSWDLFVDLQTYNPYCEDTRKNLSSAFNKVYDNISEAKKKRETLVK